MKHGAINVIEKYDIIYNTPPGETTPTLFKLPCFNNDCLLFFYNLINMQHYK